MRKYRLCIGQGTQIGKEVHVNRGIKRWLTGVMMATLVAGSVTGCQKSDGVVFSVEQAQGTEVMKVGDYSVKQDLFYLYLMQYIYNASLKSTNVDDTVKQQMIDATVSEVQLEMLEYQLALVTEGVEVSEEALTSAKQTAQNFYQVFTADLLNSYGITEEAVEQLFEQQAYVDALMDKSLADLADEFYANYEEEYKELVFHSVYYVLFPSIQYGEDGKVVTDSEGNTVPLSEDEMKEQKKKAEEVRSRAVAGESLEDLAKEYGVTYCSGTERNYTGAYEESLNQVIEALEKGDISDVIETAAGYMVVRMDEKNDEDYKSYWMAYMAYNSANNLIPTLQQNWVSSSGISSAELNQDVLSAIDVKKICKKMEDLGIAIQ